MKKSNNSLTVVDDLKNRLIIKDGNEYRIPLSTVFGRGTLNKTDSFGAHSLQENAHRVDAAISNTRELQNIWNHSHSQWMWKHLNLSYLSPWKNMKQIEAEMARKRQALNEAKWKQIKNEVKIRKLEEKLQTIQDNRITHKDNSYTQWDEIETQIKLAETREGMADSTIYIEGAMKDILALNDMFEQLKSKISDFTEEDFERAESKSHLKRSLIQCIRDVRQFGVITKSEQEYIEQIGVNPSKIQLVIQQYLEEERNSDSWDTEGLMVFVDQIVDDLIDNKKVDVKRMALMGFDSEITEGISYDTSVAKIKNDS